MHILCILHCNLDMLNIFCILIYKLLMIMYMEECFNFIVHVISQVMLLVLICVYFSSQWQLLLWDLFWLEKTLSGTSSKYCINYVVNCWENIHVYSDLSRSCIPGKHHIILTTMNMLKVPEGTLFNNEFPDLSILGSFKFKIMLQ